MAELRIGTCSWKYNSWRGLIYSHNNPINYLAEYASHYNTVEIDQWFWSLFGVNKVSLPSPFTVQEYFDSVPEDFRFTIKIPNSITLTHFYRKTPSEPFITNPYFLSVELFKKFLSSIEQLRDKLGVLMFQFEYLNKQKMSSQKDFQSQLADFIQQLDRDLFFAIEIRNPNYLNENYFAFLNELKLGHVFLQGYYMPVITSIYQKFATFVQHTTVIRLHGPNRSDIEKLSEGNWDKVLDPRDEELSSIAEMVNDLLNRKVNVYVNMNNHYEGSAPLSIKRFERFLGETRSPDHLNLEF
jgi:uncharacterized protein YecE (DUF72 family)